MPGIIGAEHAAVNKTDKKKKKPCAHEAHIHSGKE